MIRSIAVDGRPDLGGVFRPVDRPRVLERLETAAQYRIATIIAPAGFGKSVALHQFLETVPSAVLYDVPSDATTLVPFVRGFADALDVVVPGLRRSLPGALDGARDAQTPGRDLALWAATHVRTLDALIAIDDLHLGEGDVEISRFITTLVERTKGGPRWLFSSRSPLQLPVASWLAYGESDLVVDAVDLRFTLEEAKHTARASRVGVRDEELGAIIDLVDGWPAALAFALRTSTRASDLRALSNGTREMVYRYLAEQVWHALDERVRSFLRTAAFLPRLETRLAVAAGFDDAAAIIDALRERVAFITPVDAGVYRLHELFREFVVREVGLEGDHALREARIAAGRALEHIGMPGAALERYVEAGATREIVRVLGDAHFALLETGHLDVVERALRALPSGPLTVAAAILALRAAVEDAHGRSDQAERWYATVLEAPLDDVGFRVSVAWRYGLMLYQQGRREALPLLRALRERDDLSPADRAQLCGIIAITLALGGEIDDARATVDEALALAELADEELRARTYARASAVAFFAGDGAAVERYAREGTRLATECGAFGLAAGLLTTLVSQKHVEGLLPATAWYATQVVTNAEKAGNPQLRAFGLRMQLECEAFRGNEDRVVELERQLATLSYRGNVALAQMMFARAIVAMWDQRFADAQLSLRALPLEAQLAHHRRIGFALYAVVRAGAKDRQGALDAIAAYGKAVAEDGGGSVHNRDRLLAERYVVLANLLLGRVVVAQKLLRSAQPIGTDLEALDTFLAALINRNPEAAEAALRALRVAGLGGLARFVDSVSATFVASPSTPPPLTAVELEVLRAMAQGSSNQAIADEQRRTINTVRTHVSSILRKLGCESRGEAVAAARRQRLI